MKMRGDMFTKVKILATGAEMSNLYFTLTVGWISLLFGIPQPEMICQVTFDLLTKESSQISGLR
jgi:hypothetical protein